MFPTAFISVLHNNYHNQKCLKLPENEKNQTSQHCYKSLFHARMPTHNPWFGNTAPPVLPPNYSLERRDLQVLEDPTSLKPVYLLWQFCRFNEPLSLFYAFSQPTPSNLTYQLFLNSNPAISCYHCLSSGLCHSRLLFDLQPQLPCV